MTSSFFREPWFAWRAFDGVRKAMHGAAGEAERLDDDFLAQLGLFLLEQERRGSSSYSPILDFFAFCQPRIRTSHAQILQDLWVLFMLNERRDGYFVEFGACDGKLLSNTLLLEKKYDWKGILAEPNPVWHKALENNRSCNISHQCVFTHSGRTIDFKGVHNKPELSRIEAIAPDDIHEHKGNRIQAKTIPVETISLLDLLHNYNAPKIIDYLSIDTEGSEYDIIGSFDFSSYHFKLISVEHAGQKDKREAIRDLLECQGYKRWCPRLSRWDDWYVCTR